MNQTTKTLQQNFVGGALWMVALRWARRSIGLISTIILARLLSPTDFGIVALALIVTAFIELISMTGVDLAVIKEQNATREHYDTAWTIQIIQTSLMAIILAIIAPYASVYFEEPAITDVIRILAISIFINGFRNIGTLNFRKELNFSKDFYFQIYKKLFSFIIIVSFAFILKNYWALVYGMVAASIVDLLFSYKVHPFRPRFSLSRIRELWSFSQWMLLSRVGYFLNQKTDQFLIGGSSNTETMGTYHISTEVATMPTSEVAMPLRRAFFPNFAKITHKTEEFENSILKVLGFLSIAIFSIGFGVAAISEEYVHLLLGDKWQQAVPLVHILAIFGIAAALSSSMEMLLLVTGRGDLSTIESWLQLAVLFPAIWYAVHHSDIQNVAFTRTCIASLFVPIMIYFLTLATPVKFFAVIGVMWRPLLASIMMYYTIQICDTDTINIVIIRMFADIIIGAMTFTGSLFIIWMISGKTGGAEHYLYHTIQAFIKKRISKAD